MKIKLFAILFIGFLCLFFSDSRAQTSTVTYTPSHLHAAERMIDASDVLSNLQKTFAIVIQNQAQRLPEDKRQAFTVVMNKFFTKYITPEEVKKDFATIYASEYTEDELNSIADFLLTPPGKAMTNKQPELINKGMQWGQNIVLAHKDELETMMKDAMGEK
ncbi:MAG: DUF2059 domain-containing protein [Sphingobacteriales bacterium]